jgi:transcriptional regulator NrdR family protein
MNKHVFEKIAKLEKTELSEVKVDLDSQKVELGLVQDFESSVNSYIVASGNVEKQVQNIEAAIKNMQSEFVSAQKIASKIDSDYQKLRKQAMDLGVDIPKEVDNNYKTMLALLKNDLETFKKYNK